MRQDLMTRHRRTTVGRGRPAIAMLGARIRKRQDARRDGLKGGDVQAGTVRAGDVHLAGWDGVLLDSGDDGGRVDRISWEREPESLQGAQNIRVLFS